jgi:hypothetical protein
MAEFKPTSNWGKQKQAPQLPIIHSTYVYSMYDIVCVHR